MKWPPFCPGILPKTYFKALGVYCFVSPLAPSRTVRNDIHICTRVWLQIQITYYTKVNRNANVASSYCGSNIMGIICKQYQRNLFPSHDSFLLDGSAAASRRASYTQLLRMRRFLLPSAIWNENWRSNGRRRSQILLKKWTHPPSAWFKDGVLGVPWHLELNNKTVKRK
jgi:hypothetical protein